MLLEEFDRLCTSRNLTPAGNRYYGVYNSYPFSAEANRKAAGILTFHFRLSAALENHAFKSIRALMPKGYTLVAAGGSIYQLTCVGSKLKHSEIALTQVLDSLVCELRNNGILPTDVCPICHQSDCDAYADLGGYTATHRRCVENLAQDASAKAKSDLSTGSYITGFIGALLGGLVASIPSIGAYFAGWLVGYLYALIPLGAYYGYKLCKGRMNRGAFVCTLIASVIHLFLMEQIKVYIAIYLEYHVFANFFEVCGVYWSAVDGTFLLETMGMSALFMALGLWISWSQIRRNAYTDLHSAGTVRSTLIDKPGCAAAAIPAAYAPDELDRPLP